MNMMNFVLIIVAFKLTGSNTAVSGIILSFTIPAILFGILAGVFVDRWNKKLVLFYTNVLRTLLLLILVAINTNLVVIYIISFLVSVITQFFIPAETPMIPLLVKKDLLMSANALFGMGIYGSVLVAYVLSGPFLLLFGETTVFAILALLFLLAAVCVLFIKSPKTEEEHHGFLSHVNTDVLVGDIKSAYEAMKKTKDIYNSLLLLALSQFIILILAVLGPGYASHVMKMDVNRFPLLFVTPAAIGMILGAVTIGNYFQNMSKYRIAAFGAFMAGVAIMLLPYGSAETSKGFITFLNSVVSLPFRIEMYHVMMIVAFVLGTANSYIFVPSNTLLQERTHETYRGKVYGALNALIGVFSLVPVVIVGELADFYGIEVVLTGLGILIASVGILQLLIFGNKKK